MDEKSHKDTGGYFPESSDEEERKPRIGRKPKPSKKRNDKRNTVHKTT